MRIDPDKLPPPKEPYRGILPFRLLDWRIFFEREAETERLGNLVSMYGGVLLYGQSGAGKSSLLNAGLLPHILRQDRAPERIRVFPERGRELLVERIHLEEEDGKRTEGMPRYLPSRFATQDTDERIALSCEEFLEILHKPSKLGAPLLIFDQFEELVTLFEENPKDAERFAAAREARTAIGQLVAELLLNDTLPVKLIFAFRDDYLARLTPLFARIPNLMDQGVRLSLPNVDLLERIVRGPFLPSEDGEHGLPDYFGDELSEDLARKLAEGVRVRRPSGVINLSEVQTLCLALWRQPKRREELLRAANPSRVLQEIMESEAVSVLDKFIFDRLPALALLSNLVTEDGTRDVVSEENLISETRRNLFMRIHRCDWHALLNKLLTNTGLLRRTESSGTTYYELASEFLIPWIQRQQNQFRKLGLIISGFVIAGLILLLFAVGFLGYREYYQKKEAEAAKRDLQVALKQTKRAKDDAESARKVAQEAKDKAVAAKKDADQVIQFMQYDLRDSLSNLGHLEVMDQINAQIKKYYDDHPPEAGDLGSLRERAQSYTQQGRLLQSKGQLTQAADEFQSALKIFKDLLAQKPDSTDYQREICVVYEKIGGVKAEQGDLDGALQEYRRALEIREELVKKDPKSKLWRADLAWSYFKIGDVQCDQGELDVAMKSYEETFNIRSKLAEEFPDNISEQWNFAITYERIGNVLRDRGDVAAALEKYRECLAMEEKLQLKDLNNASLRRDIAVSYDRIGNMQQDQGDYEGALKSYRDGVVRWEKLARQDPRNAGWQRDLASGYDQVGDVLRAQEKFDAALKSYRDGLAIREQLAAQDASNAGLRRDIATSYNRIGDVYKDKGDYAAALKDYRDAFAIREKLAKQDQSNANWQSNLAISYENIGDVLRLQNEFENALVNYRESLGIRSKLALRNPNNADLQHDLSVSYLKTALVLEKQNQFAEALKDHQQSLAILENLCKEHSGNAGWQADLGWVYWQAGKLQLKVTPNAKQAARAVVEKGRKKLQELKSRTGLTPNQQSWLDSIETTLKAM